jgi:DNA (cytosine-5)-methyltransferase 1
VVTGVDIQDQPNYMGGAFLQGDALNWKIWDFYDFVWASPPCQAFTAYRRKGHGVGDGYPDLIDTMRQKLLAWGGPFVIENVSGAPLRKDLMLCGSMFGLDVRRHRVFECHGFTPEQPECRHDLQEPRFPQATNRANLRKTVEVGVWRIPLETQRKAMGIDWMTVKELSQAIPPAYSEYIARAVS